MDEEKESCLSGSRTRDGNDNESAIDDHVIWIEDHVGETGNRSRGRRIAAMASVTKRALPFLKMEFWSSPKIIGGGCLAWVVVLLVYLGRGFYIYKAKHLAAL